MIRYTSRAYEIFRTHGARQLIAHSLKFIASRLEHDISAPVNEVLKVGHLNAVGAVIARTIPDEMNPSIRTPFADTNKNIKFEKTAVIAHIFYPEILPEILGYLRNLPIPFGLFISTDTEDKRHSILDILSKHDHNALECDIKITPNRGRDIAPKYIAFKHIYSKYDSFIHLHTKKSLHAAGFGDEWRTYLLKSLIGSKEIAKSNLLLLSSERTGIVYPEHKYEIIPHINWGFNFHIAKNLLQRIGITLDVNTILEFPSGSMFWGRSKAIQGILDLNLDYSDFPDETGQVDGTLAHAIERSILLCAERSGHSWARVSTTDQGAKSAKTIKKTAFTPLLGSEATIPTLISRSILETKPIAARQENSDKLRLNLMIPTVDPKNIFGGIDTALKVFFQLAEKSPDADLRIIVTEREVSSVPDSIKDYLIQKIGKEAASKHVILDAYDRDEGLLNIRSSDVFIATAWWTALNAFRLRDVQLSLFSAAPKVVYLIQDFEPDFYGWSTRYALAEYTYSRGDETIAIINSEELLQYFDNKYELPTKMVIPYTPNTKVDANLTNSVREKIILFYARPSTARNCFESGIDGLSLWARRNPEKANDWKVYCIGEAFDPALASDLPNYVVTGKMSLDDYASLLSKASVGVSLMISPHPSYPPLEMAYSGVRTITNRYPGKDLSLRSDLITSIDLPVPELIANAIEKEVEFAEKQIIGKITPVRNKIRDIPLDELSFSPEYALRLIQETIQ